MRFETVQQELMDSTSASPGLIVRSPGGGLGRSSLISRKAGAGISLVSSTRTKKLRIVTTVAKKENNQSGPKNVDKSNQFRRSKRATSLSDRWPVLNRLMRSRHVEQSLPSSELSNADSSDSGEDDDDDDEGTLTLQSANKVIVHIPTSKPRYLHAWSPRRSSPLSDLGRKPGMQDEARILRHCYPHRGYSFSAFHNVKQLWIQRRFEWDQYEIEVETWRLAHAIELDNGELDSTLPPHLVGGPQRADLVTSYTSANTSTVPTYSPISENSGAIFPRLGDLSAIRDSFLISVDVWFAHFPTWTLAKLSWSYDLTHRALDNIKPFSSESLPESGISSSGTNEELASRSSDFCVADASTEVVSPSSSTLSSTSHVVSFSTDIDEMSDSTLLNSFPLPDVSQAVPFSDKNNGLLERGSLTQTVSELQGSVSSLSSTHIGTCPCCHLENPNVKKPRQRVWEECWFSRWEVMYHQVRLAAAQAGILSDQDGELSSSDIMWSDREVREIELRILTSPSVLYDPFTLTEKDNAEGVIADNNVDPSDAGAAHAKEAQEGTGEEDTNVGLQYVAEDILFYEAGFTQPIQHISRVEEDEEDYGEMIPFTESKYKINGSQFYDTSQSSSESDDSSDLEGRFELLSSIPRPHARPRRPSHNFYSASEPRIIEEDDEDIGDSEDLEKMDVDDENELSDQLENMIIY